MVEKINELKFASQFQTWLERSIDHNSRLLLPKEKALASGQDPECSEMSMVDGSEESEDLRENTTKIKMTND